MANLPLRKVVSAYKGCTGIKLRDFIRDNDAIPIIPKKVNSLVGNDDIIQCMYKYRHLVEHTFGRIKQRLGIATGYEKLERNYQSMVALVFGMIWLPMWDHWFMQSKDQCTSML